MQRDPRKKPPEQLQLLFKRYRNKTGEELDHDLRVIDLRRDDASTSMCEGSGMPSGVMSKAFNDFLSGTPVLSCGVSLRHWRNDWSKHALAFESKDVPGLLVLPGLLPSDIQRRLIDVLLHRDLSNSAHLTNVHLHHYIDYPANATSFFAFGSPAEAKIQPKDPGIHKPMCISRFLDKKLRWMTLGHQYDWTNKVYPETAPPEFPHDIKKLLMNLVPETTAEAAIVNIYSPGDTLSMHRDVSEESDCPLISISIGCDGLFVIGVDPETGESSGKHAIFRLRSGDAVYMTGQSRYAWHGVPSIIPRTCPKDLQDWPCIQTDASAMDNGVEYEYWRGWLAGKRVNLNVRQMKANGVVIV